jgi:hypothetical protein
MDKINQSNTFAAPTFKRILMAGLAGGVVLNVIDTLWSVLMMVPMNQRFLTDHSLTTSPLTGPWFLVTHFLFVIAIAWVYSLARGAYGAGVRTALVSAGALLLSNRLFGFGNVLIGTIPATVYFGFSASFILGTLVGSLVAARMIDRAVAP